MGTQLMNTFDEYNRVLRNIAMFIIHVGLCFTSFLLFNNCVDLDNEKNL